MAPVGFLMIPFGTPEFPGYRDDIDAKIRGKVVRKTLFVMGDNTWRSDDSRHFGPIAPDDVLGKVVARLPWSAPGAPMLASGSNH
jgi:hypothetical protein